VQAHSGAADLGPYRHYMQKEIFEQPPCYCRHARRRHRDDANVVWQRAEAVFGRIDSVLILACGTSYYCRSYRKILRLEAIAKLPTQVENRERISLSREPFLT